MTAEMAAKEALESGDDSGHDSPGDKSKTKPKKPSGGISAARKGVSKGKKKIIRDNFVRDQ